MVGRLVGELDSEDISHIYGHNYGYYDRTIEVATKDGRTLYIEGYKLVEFIKQNIQKIPLKTKITRTYLDLT